jgi:hypothetical protein
LRCRNRARSDGVERLGGVFRKLGASDLVPGAAVGGDRLERGSSGEGESGVDLGDGGPDGSAVLSLSLSEVVVGLGCEFFRHAVVIWARHQSSSGLDVRHWSYTCHAPVDAPRRLRGLADSHLGEGVRRSLVSVG